MKVVRLLLISFIILTISGFGYAKGPQAITDLDLAMKKAKAENKMLFIQYGREACGNCRALKNLITKRKLKLPPDEFIYVDLNCDDSKTRKAFKNRYKVKGKYLPLVVIADSEGRQLAARSGYGTQGDYKNLISGAKVKNKSNLVIKQRSGHSSMTMDSSGPATEKKVKTIEDIRKSLGR